MALSIKTSIVSELFIRKQIPNLYIRSDNKLEVNPE